MAELDSISIFRKPRFKAKDTTSLIVASSEWREEMSEEDGETLVARGDPEESLITTSKPEQEDEGDQELPVLIFTQSIGGGHQEVETNKGRPWVTIGWSKGDSISSAK